MPVVHVIAAHVRLDADTGALEDAARAAQGLSTAPGVEAAVVGRSPKHLIAAVWLPDAASLEPFAASEPHMTFVMRGLAPVIVGMWSASITSDRPAPAAQPAALWAFSISEAEGIFEWQVQRALDTIGGLPGEAWLGPTIEERERVRAGGVALLSSEEVDAFRSRADALVGGEIAIEVAFAATVASDLS
jgi:hypothetical protein